MKQSTERKKSTKNLYAAKLSFKNEGKIKKLSDEQKQRICCQWIFTTGNAKGSCLD